MTCPAENLQLLREALDAFSELVADADGLDNDSGDLGV